MRYRVANAGVREKHRAQKVGTCEQIGSWPAEANCAALEEVCALGHRQSDVDALLDHDDGNPAGRKALDDWQQLANDDGCEPQRQFVDEQHARASDKCHAKRKHLLLATTEVGRCIVEALLQNREHLEHFGGAGLDLIALAALCPTSQLQVLANRQRAEDSRSTGHLRNTQHRDLVWRSVSDVATIEHHGSTIGLDDATHGFEQR